MNLQLLNSCPGKRFDNEPRLSDDGRGGWQLFQLNTDRWLATFEDYYLVLYFAVLASEAKENDFVEKTKLTATMDGEEIGTDLYEWKIPNHMWGMMDDEAIFEWAQAIDLYPKNDGLITFSIEAKIHSQDDWLPVNGHAYTRIRDVGRVPALEKKWINSWLYPFLRLIPKRFRRSRSEY